MTDQIVDGMTGVWFIPSVAAPQTEVTLAEMAAATYIGSVLTPTGLEGFEPSPGEVDNTAFDSTFDTRMPGTSTVSGTRLVLKKQTGTDLVYDLLTEFGTPGFIGIRHDVPKSTAPAASQKLDLHPITTGAFARMAPERNTVARYWVATPISDEPQYDVPIVAGP